MAKIHQKQTVLVTGSGGRLGRLLRASARGMEAEKAGLRVFFQSRCAAPGVDIRWSPGAPTGHLPPCDTVVALWGATSGDAAALALNETLVAESNRVARGCGARRLLHLSSAAVYGPGEAMDESRPPAPQDLYGRSKYALEAAVARLPGLAQGGPAQTCLRLANVVGADSLAPALRGERHLTLDRFADGRGPLRSYIAATRFLRVITGLARLPPERLPAHLNLCTPEPVEMEALARAAGLAPNWRTAPRSAIQRVTLDARRLCALLPSVTLADTAQEMIADLRRLESLA